MTWVCRSSPAPARYIFPEFHRSLGRTAAELSGVQGVESVHDTNWTAPRAQNPGGSASADVYEGCNPNYVNGKQELLRAPGNSIGAECAHISNEVDPKTQK